MWYISTPPMRLRPAEMLQSRQVGWNAHAVQHRHLFLDDHADVITEKIPVHDAFHIEVELDEVCAQAVLIEMVTQ